MCDARCHVLIRQAPRPATGDVGSSRGSANAQTHEDERLSVTACCVALAQHRGGEQGVRGMRSALVGTASSGCVHRKKHASRMRARMRP